MDLLDAALDVIFKTLLLGDTRLLPAMIKSVLGLTEPIVELSVLNPELPGLTPGEHGVVFDLRVRLASGEEIDLEIFTRGSDALHARLLFYWARHYASQLPRGMDYEQLRPVRLIVWTTRPIVDDADYFHETFRLVGTRSGTLFSPHFTLHLVDLSRIGLATEDDDPGLVLWGRFFTLDGDVERANLLAAEDPIMSIAVAKLKELSADPVTQRIAADRERDLLMYGHDIATARKDGEAIGEARGIAVGEAIGEARGIAVGEARGIAVGEARGIAVGEAQGLRAAIESAADVVGVKLTPARRRELERADVEALRMRHDRLLRERVW